jgi:hypothetical protein
MHRPSAVRAITTAGVLCLLAVAVATSQAQAGEFTVATCQADRANFSTSAVDDFASRGMTIRRACNPEGPGIRGLVTANVATAGIVQRGSVALATIAAPAGTSFTTFRWAGSARRVDCRYALQIYADGPGLTPVSIKNVRANRNCPKPGVQAQAAGYRSRVYNVTGATRIVQRVICEGGGGRRSCSARGTNYIRTYQAEIGIADTQPPAASITPDTPLASGAWVSGEQPLNFDAEDNVGIRGAQASVADRIVGAEARTCVTAGDDGAYATAMPCPNGPGSITVDTTRLPDGTQTLTVDPQDSAGNVAASPPATIRVDNTAPARVTTSLTGGDAWRNTNDFSLAWANPDEGDRAPIVAADYKLCPAAGGACTQGEAPGDGIAALPMPVTAPGQWTLSIWRRDAAGNADPATVSDPVTLRYDPDPPQLAFDPNSTSDPTLISVPVTDAVSGLADGAIEISAAGSDTWQTLATQKDGSRLVARIDDAAMPAGAYVLRATAHDQANNEASTTTRTDGQLMTVTLPLRIPSTMRAGIARERTVKRRRGHPAPKPTTVLESHGVVPFGQQVQVSGQLANRDGQGVARAEVQVFASISGAPEQLVGVVQTDASGSYTYTAAGSASRTLRFAYAGSPVMLPADSSVGLDVPAASTLKVSRTRVLNGQHVTFTGQVQSAPIPQGGKLIQLEVQLSGRWQTFRTARTDAAGNWALPYRFARTRGIQWYRFRVELPPEAGYPFVDGASRSLRVRVRGRA